MHDANDMAIFLSPGWYKVGRFGFTYYLAEDKTWVRSSREREEIESEISVLQAETGEQVRISQSKED